MNVTAAQLPLGTHYGTGWVTTKIPFGEQIESFDYHSRTESYAVGTSRKADYKLSVDDAWATEGDLVYVMLVATLTNESDTAFLPQVEQGFIKLLDRKTSSIVHR